MPFSDYIIYVDESGDHSLTNINPRYPIFALAFCIFHKDEYVKTIAPSLNALKLKYWGHCDTVLHEHDIRKSMKGDWAILSNESTRTQVKDDLSLFIENTPFHIIATVIDKTKHANRYSNPENPYEIAMLMCMERLHDWLIHKGQTGKTVHIQFESRGNKEDKELELEFRRICGNSAGTVYSKTDFSVIDYKIRFLSKKSNSTGLQISDLVARPIGMKILRPTQENRAFNIIEQKLITHDNAEYMGRGLKVFP